MKKTSVVGYDEKNDGLIIRVGWMQTETMGEYLKYKRLAIGHVVAHMNRTSFTTRDLRRELMNWERDNKMIVATPYKYEDGAQSGGHRMYDFVERLHNELVGYIEYGILYRERKGREYLYSFVNY